MVPTPNLDSSDIFPRISSTRFLEIVRPSPVPPNRLAVELSACEKGLNSFWRISSSMPMPVSSTVKCTSSISCVSRLTLTRMVTLPSDVNLIEFVNRLVMTCLRRPGSPTTFQDVGSSMSSMYFRPFRLAAKDSILFTSFTTTDRSNCTSSMSNRPDSTLLKSSMSLITVSSPFALR